MRKTLILLSVMAIAVFVFVGAAFGASVFNLAETGSTTQWAGIYSANDSTVGQAALASSLLGDALAGNTNATLQGNIQIAANANVIVQVSPEHNEAINGDVEQGIEMVALNDSDVEQAAVAHSNNGVTTASNFNTTLQLNIQAGINADVLVQF